MSLPTDSKKRKQTPITTGVLDYFPDAIAEVARVSFIGNEQHNPGEPLHWAREKSTDHADCITRHLLERGQIDTDGTRHSAKLAWRALALLQIELEEAAANVVPPVISEPPKDVDPWVEDWDRMMRYPSGFTQMKLLSDPHAYRAGHCDFEPKCVEVGERPIAPPDDDDIVARTHSG